MMKTTAAHLMATAMVLTMVGCDGPLSTRVEIDGLALALTMPTADVNEVRSLGVFVLEAVSPEVECEDYYAGTADPITQHPGAVESVDFVNVREGTEGMNVSLNQVQTGEKTLVVEAYDGGGSRIFLGCGVIYVEEGKRAEIEIIMSRDPSLPTDDQEL